MITITIPEWQYLIVLVFCLLPTINKVLEYYTERLRRKNHEMTKMILDRCQDTDKEDV